MDDLIKSQDLNLIEEAESILKKRVQFVSDYINKRLDKDFDFTKREFINNDSEKRKRPSSLKELENLWRKILKWDVLSRFSNRLLEKKSKEDKKKNKEQDEKENKEIKKTAYEREKRRKQ